MDYKGYEIRRVKTKFVKNETPIEVEAWGIYANGDFKGSALTKDEALACIDRLAAGELYTGRGSRGPGYRSRSTTLTETWRARRYAEADQWIFTTGH